MGEAEEKRLAMEMSLVKQDYDVNELTLSCSEGTGKFMKPQLKRVNKTAAKIKKSSGESDSAKAAAFRSGLTAPTLSARRRAKARPPSPPPRPPSRPPPKNRFRTLPLLLPKMKERKKKKK